MHAGGVLTEGASHIDYIAVSSQTYWDIWALNASRGCTDRSQNVWGTMYS